MKPFLTIAICAIICSIQPADVAPAQFSEVSPERGVMAANTSRFIVIDTRKLTEDLYVFHNDGQGWVISVPVGLGGTVPDDDDEPDPEPGTPLAQVKAAFGSDVQLFEKQRELMIEALELPDGMVDVAAINAWVQRGFKVAVGNHAHFWEPWLAQYHTGAESAAGSAAEMIEWVATAAESLQ